MKLKILIISLLLSISSFAQWGGEFGFATAQWDSYTKLMLHMDGTNLSTNFIDEIGKTVTANGTCYISTAQGKFSQSGYFDGSTGYLTVPNSPDFDLGTGDFTVDLWFYKTADNTSLNQGLIATAPSATSGTEGWAIAFSTASPSQIYVATNGAVIIAGIVNISLNAWHHFALVRYAGTIKLYIDGIAESNTSTTALQASTQPLSIGRPMSWSGGHWASNYGTYFPGYIDEVRISVGIARWTSNFTPPTNPYFTLAKFSQATTLALKN